MVKATKLSMPASGLKPLRVLYLTLLPKKWDRDYGLKHVLSPVEGPATLVPLRHRIEPCGTVFLRKVRTPRKGSVASHTEKTLR